MKKAILYSISAIFGVVVGILLHCSFMVTSAHGVLMLPTIEPGQTVVICLLDKDVEKGDVVAYIPPYYTLDGEGNIVFRRVEDDGKGKESDRTMGPEGQIHLTCDTNMTENHNVKISKEELLGTVILWDDVLKWLPF